MYKSKLYKVILVAGIILGMALLSGCSSQEISKPAQEQGGFIKIAPGAYDSADTAIVVSKQNEQKKITFFNLQKQKNYTLNYDGITKFTDKYGSQISVEQLKEGEVVNLQFLKDEKLLTSLSVSADVWTLRDISKYELDAEANIMKIMNEDYTLEEATLVFSNGEKAEISDIMPQDVLEIKGIDYKIYTITIEKGHGYLSLENEDFLIGGWIEVGQKIIHQIEPDMRIRVPEGSYSVYLSHAGIEGTKEVVVKKNEETILDVGDLKKEDLIKYGKVSITVEPSTARVYVDGQQINTGRLVKVPYGLHQIMTKATGYDTQTQYIRVNEDMVKITISLEEEKERTVSANSVSGMTPDE